VVNERVWDRIERSRERWNVLRHPFYQRWSAGELNAEELARYSGQYRHAVEAIATLSKDAAAAMPQHPELHRHAAEEVGHVRLWDGFVDACGGCAEDAPSAETA
jgi:pyrroloquinoline-quinone synthase